MVHPLLDSTANPKPRHAYTYMPRPNQRGYLQYSGPLQSNLAAQQANMNNGMNYGMGYGGMGYSAGYGAGYGVPGYYGGVGPYHNRYHSAPYIGGYGGYGAYGPYGYNRYSNYSSMNQPCYLNGSIAYSGNAVQCLYIDSSASTVVAPAAAPQFTYVTAASTPARLPAYYTSRDYESRRVATQRGAYAARKIKPADALPDDPFWCRERDGQWNLRNYYTIERDCQPGRWQMDAEKGFLVFHRH